MNKNIIISILLILCPTFGLLGMEGQQEQQGKKRPFPLEKEVDSQQPNSQKKAKPSLEHYSFCPVHAISTHTRQALTTHIEIYHYNNETSSYDCRLCQDDFPKPYDVFLHWFNEHELFDMLTNADQLLRNENTPKITIDQNFCPCGQSKEKTVKGFCYRHLRSHHRNEKTNLINCPFECGATFTKPGKIVMVHLKDKHNFFFEEDQQISNPGKTSDDMPEQSPQQPQEIVASESVTNPTESIIRPTPSFCPCDQSRAKTMSGFHDHLKSHHYDEETKLFHCPFPNCDATLSREITIPHLEDVHNFFIEERLIYDHSKTPNVPEQSSQQPQEIVAFESVTNPTESIIRPTPSLCPCGQSRAKKTRGFYNHLKYHHYNEETKLFHCPYKCGETFSTSKITVFHLEDVHNFFIEDRLIYDPSKDTEQSPQEIAVHKFVVHECPMYNKNIITIKELTEHIDTNHRDDNLFVCKYGDCSRSFAIASDVIKHLINRHKLFVKKANKLIPISEPLQSKEQQTLSLEKEPDSQQPDSQKKVRQKKSRRKKARMSIEYSFCPVHIIKTQTRSGLLAHIKKHYNKEKNQFDCLYCPNSFPRPYGVYLHWVEDHELFNIQGKDDILLPNENTKKITLKHNAPEQSLQQPQEHEKTIPQTIQLLSGDLQTLYTTAPQSLQDVSNEDPDVTDNEDSNSTDDEDSNDFDSTDSGQGKAPEHFSPPPFGMYNDDDEEWLEDAEKTFEDFFKQN